MSNDFFNQLPDDLKQLLKTSGKAISDQIRINAREENIKSKKLLQQAGIEFVWDWDDETLAEFIAMRDAAAKHLEQTDYIPGAIFERTKKLLDTYRNSHPDNT